MDARRLSKVGVQVLLTIVGIVCAIEGRGQQPQIDKCSIGSMVDMKECVGREYRAAESRLNAALEKLKLKLEQNASTEEAKWLIQELTATQGKWTGYRNSECEFQRSILGSGSLAGLAFVSCMHSLTEARAREVEVTATTWGAD